jgi:hypothetical protein
MNFIYNCIDVCNRDEISYYNQSLVILESSPRANTVKSPESFPNFFGNSKVSRIIAVERPQSKNAQLYIAHGLSTKFHFSCLMALLPSLMEAIEHYNNKDMKLLFVPCHTDLLNDNSMTVINNVPVPLMFRNNKAQEIYDSVIESGEKIGNNSLAASRKRSNHSFSIGLQTMYAHQQHCARYCMLPYSRPHVTDVKKYPKSLGESILHAYGYVESILSRVNNINKQHPFDLEQLPTRENAAEVVERLNLRNDLLTYFSNQRSEEDEKHVVLPAREAMFEACTIQPTDALGFHKDTMNCSNLDNTIALIVPTNVTSATGNDISLSYLQDASIVIISLLVRCIWQNPSHLYQILLKRKLKSRFEVVHLPLQLLQK